ncbi:MAG TPA: hypothetical protein VKN99_26800 [Polyangia bacterium]|nr:hypothetical protein [Polyangia bacterium]
MERSLAILRVEDLPAVREASWFRQGCARATAGTDGDQWAAGRKEQVRTCALHVLACSAAAYRVSGWRIACRRLAAGERARADAMRALYELHRAGVVPARLFDRVAIASAELRGALAALAMEIRERR